MATKTKKTRKKLKEPDTKFGGRRKAPKDR